MLFDKAKSASASDPIALRFFCPAESWRLCKGDQKDQVLVETPNAVVGQVNRRAAAILAPLLEGEIIGTELKLNQEADGRRCKVLYIYALLGVGDNKQVNLFLDSA